MKTANILGGFIGLVLFFIIKEVIDKVADIYNRKKQHVFIYCPKCRTELMKNGELLEDDGSYITYRCKKCHTKSKWDAIHYPIPMWIDELQCDKKED